MKEKLFLALLLCATTVFSQDIPCDFTWNSAPTTTGTKDFVTAVRSQPYQGPCLAFAFNAAIETVYGMENNVSGSSLFSLSDAYLDYKVWHSPFYLPTLNSTFKTPLKALSLSINNFAPSSCPVNNPDLNGCTIPRSQITSLINHPNGQRSYSIFFNTNVEPPVWDVEDGGALGNYITVGNAVELTSSSITSIDDIKTTIMNDGPIVVQVSGIQNNIHDATLFRNYTIPSAGLSYHAFAIIGWTDDDRWVIKDSWPGMAGIVNTKQNVGIINLMNSGSVKLYQVSTISYNGGTAANNPITLSTTECTTSTVPLELSNIGLEIDYVTIGGYLYHRFWVTSNLSVDNWVWGIDYPNGAYKRSQTNGTHSSSILMTPWNSGTVTVYVRAHRGSETVTKERVIYLFNGQSSGGGGGGLGFGW